MKVLVTLDNYNGVESKSVITDLDGLNLQSLMYRMMQGEICGFTVSKYTNILNQLEKSKNESS